MTAGVSQQTGISHPLKIIANIFISFIGAGVLGLPYAFKEAGLAEGILIMSAVGYVSVRAMFLIIDCKYCLLQQQRHSFKQYKYTKIEVRGTPVELKLPLVSPERASDDDEEDDDDDGAVQDGVLHHEMTYGDLGFHAYGDRGRLLVDITVVITQIGFCCAYLIFICENMSSYMSGVSTSRWLVLLLPPLYLLCLLRNLSRLAVFSVFAQASTILAFAVVFWFDFEHYHVMRRFHPQEFSLAGFPFYFAIAIYCYEGAGMILSLEHSLSDTLRPKFKQFFARTMLAVTALYIVFGCSGYLSFGPFTREIITLNLPHGGARDGGVDFAMIVKCCLCLSLFFTYPLMLFPVVTIIENRLSVNEHYTRLHGNALRLCVVACSGLVVVVVPNFADLMAIVGGTCCTLLAFTLPGIFHLKIMNKRLTRSQRHFDLLLIVMGVCGTLVATWDTLRRMTDVHEQTGSPSQAQMLRELTDSPLDVANITNTSHLLADSLDQNITASALLKSEV